MLNPNTRCYINVMAILASLSELCDLDDDAKKLLPRKTISVAINVRKGPHLVLSFSPTGCQRLSGKRQTDIVLYFRSCEHLNAMMDGNAAPWLLKGFTKIGFLRHHFEPLTKRLESILKADKSSLEEETLRRLNTLLTLSVASATCVQIANQDRAIAQTTQSIPDGVIALRIASDHAFYIGVKQPHFTLLTQSQNAPRATMQFASIDAAYQMLHGYTDTYSSIATGELLLAGFIPMLEGLDKLLYRANFYLK